MAVHYFDPCGVDSLRDNGYRDTAMALAELIDNSIQANAKKVEIFLIERLPKTGKREFLVDEILVVDNGDGMDQQTLETSLRFGGGTRHGATKGLGKFGMGLPNSSASQCPRFEVFSWKTPEETYFNYFDFTEIRDNNSEYLPDIVKASIPDYISAHITPMYNHGTIVRWVNCDRLILKRANKLVPHIIWPLGRIYRYYLQGQLVDISVRVISDNGHSFTENFNLAKKLKPVDPLFLMTGTQLFSPYDSQATSEPWEGGEYIFPDPNGDAKNKSLYQRIGDSIKIKCSIAKKESKRTGGGKSLGSLYEEFMGISIVRANREIKIGPFGFIGDISDPTHRWWKIEVNFEPPFDSFFGLDNTKQNVHSFKKIKDKEQLLETTAEENIQLEFISELSSFIEHLIKGMKSDIDKIDAGSRSGGKGGVNPGDGGGTTGPFPDEVIPVPLPEEDSNGTGNGAATDDQRKELEQWLLLRYPEYAKDPAKLKLAIDWFFTAKYNQVIVFLQLGAAEFFNYKTIGHRTIIEINTNHSFYFEFIKPIFDEKLENKIDPLLLLFGAMVEAEKHLISYKQYIEMFRSFFAVKLSEFLLAWKDSK